MKQLTYLYYRICMNGKNKIVLAGVEKILNGTKEFLTATILHRLAKDKVPLNKIFCFGSDRASSFSGVKEGVVARLLTRNPLIVAFHCVTHREALACKAAAEEIHYLKTTFFPITEQLGRFYHDSHTRTTGFSRKSDSNNSPKIYRFNETFAINIRPRYRRCWTPAQYVFIRILGIFTCDV
eukprot:Pompholyxophrys_punicea_v1_NODE_791_length_1289_cov_2.265802.p1 type:complete len:181 gc:universal NODE_791_length_1289_cov_2.265802:734-192(-)